MNTINLSDVVRVIIGLPEPTEDTIEHPSYTLTILFIHEDDHQTRIVISAANVYPEEQLSILEPLYVRYDGPA